MAGVWQHDPLQPGTDPQRRDYAGFAGFADPDGSAWVLQEIGFRPPDTAGRIPVDR